MKALLERWASFRRLDWAAPGRVVEAAAALTGVWLGLRALGYRRTRAAIMRGWPVASGTPAGAAEIGAITGELVWSLGAARQAMPYAPTCLHRTLALWWMLRRRGIDSEVRIGTVRTEGGLAAHAWLERDGVVLNDEADVGERFAAFPPGA